MEKLSFLMQIRKAIICMGAYGFLLIPYFIIRIGQRISHRKQKVQLDEYLYYLCQKLHIPMKTVARIEVIFFQDPYEAEVAEFLSLKTKGELFVDIGANLGRYIILLGRNYKKVVAIEPDPINMCFLKENVNYAKLSNVEFLEFAVSNRDGYATLYFSSHIGGHTLMQNFRRGNVKVKSLTLASLLFKEPRIDLVKVDVEGAEWLVLKGAEPILDKIKSWVIELHYLDQKEKLQNYLAEKGYRWKWLDVNHIYAWR